MTVLRSEQVQCFTRRVERGSSASRAKSREITSAVASSFGRCTRFSSASDVSAAFTVTFTATAQVGTPTGNVTVTASGGGSCTGALSGGQGFCVLTPAGTGNLTLTADYPGNTLSLIHI